MAEVYDADGNLVEGYLSPEEVTAKIEAEKAAWLEANKPPVTEQKPSTDEPPAWAKGLMDTVERLSGNQRSTIVKDFVNNLDADKQKEFDAKYNALTGYDETPEGIARRAQDAYLLTTGQPYNATAINMQSVVAAGGSPTRPNTVQNSEADKAIQSVFGITEEDVKKHGTN